MSRVVYTTTEAGAILLYAMLGALLLIGAGLATGISGVTAGGLAIFGAVFVCAVILSEPKENL